jgi:hypothetical protein
MDASTPDRMVIRRSTPHGDRRRRVVVKDPAPSASGTAGSSRTAGDSSESRTTAPRRYAAAALREEQPRVCDWIPTGLWSLSAWFLGLSVLVASVGGLHLLALETGRRWQVDLPSLRVDTGRNFSHFVQAALWLMAASCCRQILHLRRHRVDDYRGRYRVWYPVALASLLFCVNAVTGLSQNLVLAAPKLQSSLGVDFSASWSHLSLLAVVTLAAGRLAAELWACRSAVVSLGLACVLAWSMAIARLVGGFSADSPAWTLVESLGSLATTHFFFFAMLLNLRHVFLDAQGELPVREAKPRAASGKQEVSSDVPAVAAPAPTAGNLKAVPKVAPPRQQEPAVEQEAEEEPEESEDLEDSGEDEDGHTVSMSRAERKRQRKMQQTQKRAA